MLLSRRTFVRQSPCESNEREWDHPRLRELGCKNIANRHSETASAVHPCFLSCASRRTAIGPKARSLCGFFCAVTQRSIRTSANRHTAWRSVSMSINRSHKDGLSASSQNIESAFGQFGWPFERLMGRVEELCALTRQNIAATEESRALLLDIKTHLDSLPIRSGYEPDLITIKEAARQLVCSERHVIRLGESGELEIVRRGRYVRVTRSSLEAHIERHKGGKDE